MWNFVFGVFNFCETVTPVTEWSIVCAYWLQLLSLPRFESHLDDLNLRNFVSSFGFLKTLGFPPPSLNWLLWYKLNVLDWGLKLHFSALKWNFCLCSVSKLYFPFYAFFLFKCNWHQQWHHMYEIMQSTIAASKWHNNLSWYK